MQNKWKAEDRRRLLLCLVIFGLMAALFILPSQFSSSAGGKQVKKGLFQQTKSHEEGIENYDIRSAKQTQEIADAFVKYRQSAGKDAAVVADIRADFVRGEEELRSRVPHVKFEYNDDIRIPEVITPDVMKGTIEWLSSPSTVKRSELLRNFVKENNSLTGVSDEQADGLRVQADYTNPDGNISYALLEQYINDVPVFRGEVKAGFTKSGQIIRVINNLAPGLDYGSLSNDFRDPVDAVKAAFSYINKQPSRLDVDRNAAESTDLKVKFGNGDWATTAEKMYFPTEPGVAVPAWRVLIWQPVNAYYVIVAADDGRMLWRKNIANDQTQSATYNVYNNANAYMNAADSPNPFSAGPLDPTAPNIQGARINRSLVTLIGNEGTLNFNNNGWITDGANITDGNAVEAGVDRDTTNGVDAASIPVGSPNRTFNYPFNPGNPVDNTGDAPTPNTPTPCVAAPPAYTDFQKAAATQMFYVMNRYHDELYKRGFTEQARNFQASNFGRGGVENDRVSAEGQDCSGTNNANFATPADGGRGRMQMFIWTGPTPDFDGTIDAEVIIHEVTHGTSNRLHGNGSGLGTNFSSGMGEGWSDWYSYTLLSEPTDPINGIYTTGGYATYLIAAGFTANYYYGIRRFPRAPITFLGGPTNKPHNPFTFRYLNSDCNTLIGTTTSNPPPNSAYPRGPIGVTQCDQVHNVGEVWSSMLWEVRNRFVTRLGHTAGTTRALQVVTDGMKLAPLQPTFIQERDAIIAAAAALPAVPEAALDVLDVREGFRARGLGFSASIQSAVTPLAVTEAFDGWTLAASGAPTVTSGNGLLEPNECNTLNIPLSNNGGAAATGITAVLTTTTPGITVTQPNSAYPDIPVGGGPVNNTTPFEVSIDNTVACFTTANFTLTVTFSGAGGGSPLVSNFSLPVGLPGNVYNFTAGTGGTIPAGGTLVAGSTADDAAVALTLPSGWTSTIYNVPVTSITASTNGLIGINGTPGTAFTNTALPAAANAANPTLSLLWDDMDMDAADVTNGGIYTNTIGSAPNRQFVIEWRAQHFAETANGPVTINIAAILNEGSANFRYVYVLTGIAPNANGVSATVGVQRQSTGTQFTQFSFNQAVIMPGMTLDAVLPPGQCTPGPGGCGTTAVAESRADFDNDGKTDFSVFRTTGADVGTWYLQQSMAGFGAIKWGVGTDTPTPGDFDGDNKTDFAVFRPDANSANPDFWILNSNGFTVSGVSWGVAGDIPVIRDYDGDDKEDVAVFRPSNNVWYILRSGGGTTITTFGQAGDVPVAGDFDGDGRGDLTVYRSGTWIGQLSGGGSFNTPFGAAGDILVPADYSGNAADDLAVFRPSTGQWIHLPSGGGAAVFTSWGTSGDVPAPGDYDGDGKDDQAIYRNGQWWVNRSTGGTTVVNFGIATDKAIPRSYVP